jgi:uncharacterized membrane protein YGL010W
MFNRLVSQLPFSVINLSIEGLVEAVVYMIVLGAVVWLLLWLVTYCGLPEPFAKVAKMIIVVVSVLLLICLLLSFIGHPVFQMRT